MMKWVIRYVPAEVAIIPAGWAVYYYDSLRCEARIAPFGVAHLLRAWHWTMHALRKTAAPAEPSPVEVMRRAQAFTAGHAAGFASAIAQIRAVAPSVRTLATDAAPEIQEMFNQTLTCAILIAADRVERGEVPPPGPRETRP